MAGTTQRSSDHRTSRPTSIPRTWGGFHADEHAGRCSPLLPTPGFTLPCLYLFSERTELAPHNHVLGLRGGWQTQISPGLLKQNLLLLAFSEPLLKHLASSTRGPEPDREAGLHLGYHNPLMTTQPQRVDDPSLHVASTIDSLVLFFGLFFLLSIKIIS